MKKILLLIFLIITISSNSQKSKKDCLEYQKKWFNKAENYIADAKIDPSLKKLFLSASSYYASYYMEKETELGKKAKFKTDSLITILRNRKINNLIGEWKQLKGNKNEPNHLKIKSKKIIEYNKHGNRKKVIKKEKITYLELEGIIPYFYEIKYKNGDLWDFKINKSNDTLSIIYSGNIFNKNKSKIRKKYIRIK